MTQRGHSRSRLSSVSDFTPDFESRARRQCESLLAKTLQEPFDVNDSNWQLKHEKQGIQVYRKFLQDKELEKYVSRGVLDTSLACVAAGLHTDTSDDYRIVASILYEREFLDAKVLRVFETKCDTGDDDSFRFAGLKYLKTQMPIQSAYATRDAVFYEYSGCRQSPQGQKYLFIVQDAVALKAVPTQKNIARESLTMVYLFMELPGNRVQFTMESYVVPNGLIPTWFCAYSYWQTSTRLAALPETRHLVSGQKFLGPVTWVPDGARKCCIVCLKKFNPLRSRHHCRACGDIMCSSCTSRIAFTPLYLHSDPSNLAMQEHKVCLQCMRVAKRELSMRPVFAGSKRRPTASSISTLGSPPLESREGEYTQELVAEAKAILRGQSRSEPGNPQVPISPREAQRAYASMDEGKSKAVPMPMPAPVVPLTREISQGFIVCQFKGQGDLESIRTPPEESLEFDVDEAVF